VQRLQRYIFRQLLGPLVFFLLALTGIIWLTQSLRFVELIVNRGLSAGYFLYLSMLVLPSVLSLILPVALFAAVVYAYQRLQAESEIVVMRSAGLSNANIARPAIVLAVIVTLVGYGLTLYFMPAGKRAFHDTQLALRSNLSYVLLQEGRFNNIGSHLTVYVRTRLNSGELRGILVHDSRNPDEPVTMMAESGALVSTSAGPRFVLVNGNRQQVDRAGGGLSLLQFDKYTLDLSQFISKDERRWLEPSERFLNELIWPGGQPEDISNANALWAELHDRVASPFYALAFVMIGLACLLSGQFSRRHRGWRIISAASAVLLVRAAGLGFVSLTIKVPALAPLIYLNLALPIGVSIWLLWRTPGRIPALQPPEEAGA
jgi:lipopolysaccharide export system permease protein